jgi:hypothetical protein
VPECAVLSGGTLSVIFYAFFFLANGTERANRKTAASTHLLSPQLTDDPPSPPSLSQEGELGPAHEDARVLGQGQEPDDCACPAPPQLFPRLSPPLHKPLIWHFGRGERERGRECIPHTLSLSLLSLSSISRLRLSYLCSMRTSRAV